MILEAWYLGRKVLVTVPATMRVFDGQNFVDPALALTVELAVPVSQTVTEQRPDWEAITAVTYVTHNFQICTVLNIYSSATGISDVISVADPTGGDPLLAVLVDNKGNRVMVPAFTTS